MTTFIAIFIIALLNAPTDSDGTAHYYQCPDAMFKSCSNVIEFDQSANKLLRGK